MMIASSGELPSDMLWEIATWLDPESYLQMQATCKRFNKVLGEPYRRDEYRRTHTIRSIYNEYWRSVKFWKYDHRTCIKDDNDDGYCFIGDEYWYFDNVLHRGYDEPAVKHVDGGRHWFRNGEIHRDNDKPARMFSNGDNSWYQNGKQHREGDKPAHETVDGYKHWQRHGLLHRDGDEPAVEYANGAKEWWVDGGRIK